MADGYDTRNLEKYATHNPLKKLILWKLNRKIVSQMRALGEKIRLETGVSVVTILDVGCGEGFVDRLLLDNLTGVKITGVDFSAAALEVAKKLNPEAEYILGDIYDLPFHSREFDIVLCTDVIEQLQKPALALKQIARVAKYKVLVTVPRSPWWRLANLLAGCDWSRLGNPPNYYNHWTKGQFLAFCETSVSGVWRMIRIGLTWMMTVWTRS